MDASKYIGTELEIFQEAKNWKSYWSKQVRKFIRGEVLEVGAGIGGNINYLIKDNEGVTGLTCIEPDQTLTASITRATGNQVPITVFNGYLSNLPTSQKFDTILYIDVLEHIADDQKEVELAKTFLKEGGNLIILVPAHQYLYSPFDQAIGHFRRYEKQSLEKLVGKNLQLNDLFFLDSVGLLTSLVNKHILRQSLPTKAQILFWDRKIIPFSKIVDFIIGKTLGRSLIGIWTND